MRRYFFYLITLVCLLSCKKEKLNIGSFWKCNEAENLDSSAVSAKILGSWLWVKQACEGSGKTIPANKQIKAIFNNNHTFTINEGLVTITQGNWKMVPLDGTAWGLELSAPSEYLNGRILFCGNQVLFNESYIDGCDHLFLKSN